MQTIGVRTMTSSLDMTCAIVFANRQTDRQTDRHTDRQTDRERERLSRT